MEGVSLEIRTVLGEKLGFKLGLRVGTEPRTDIERKLEGELYLVKRLEYRMVIELGRRLE